jgi:hypothetical protein
MPAPSRRRRAQAFAVVLCAAAAVSCGKKGPPLAPLRPVPGPVSELSARRTGDEVRLAFVLPTANANAPGRIDLDHLEIFAVTVAPGSVTPPNRDLTTKTYAVGTIEVKPAPIAGEAPPAEGTPADSRPAPGEAVTFVEPVTDATLTPAPLPKAPPPAVPGVAPVAPLAPGAVPAGAAAAGPVAPVPQLPGAPPAPATPAPAAPAPAATAPAGSATTAPAAAPPAAGAAPAGAPPATAPGAAAPGAAAPAAEAPTYPVRIYVIRGVSKAGRAGQLSARVAVPLVSPPAAPIAPRVSFNDKAVVLQWIPPVAEVGGPAIAFNVYRTDGPAAGQATPLNPAPLTEPQFETTGVTFGQQLCVAVRGVQTVQNVRIEGAATQPACVTPRDIFPPAAPQRVSLLLLDGAIDLVWDTSPEPDVKGYVVLRGEAAGGTLRPLTPAPIQETTFRDTSVTPGVRYVYAVTAVDGAGNTSAESAHVEGVAR